MNDHDRKALAQRVRELGPLALVLAIGGAGGLAFKLAGMPAPWLSGPGMASALAALAGMKVAIPEWLKRISLVFLGMMAGSAVTPETLDTLGRWPLSLAGLVLAVGLVMTACAFYLERVHGYDPATARLSSVPGALPFVLALAAESTGDVRRIAIIQMVRLVLLLVALPSVLALAGLTSAAAPPRPIRMDGSLTELALLAAAGAGGGYLFERLRAPAPYLFGSMIVAALLAASGLVSVELPAWLMIPGLVVIGTVVGSNFSGIDAALLRSTLAASLGSMVVAAGAAMVVAVPVAWLLAMPVAQVWIAYAPGGVDVMAVMAMALGLDVAFVGGHHAVRFLGLGLVVPFWVRRHLVPARRSDGPPLTS